MLPRSATVKRDTQETQITVTLNLDGTGRSNLNTGLPFLDHMLDQVARHGLFDLDIEAQGDLHIDAHRCRNHPWPSLYQGPERQAGYPPLWTCLCVVG